MGAANPTSFPVPVAGLASFVAAVAAMRARELWRSRRHERALAGRGGTRIPEPGFAAIVALHVAWPLALVSEVVFLGARPPATWPVWLAVLVLAFALREWSFAALGDRWTARLWIVPGAPRVRTGPYRLLRHPAYVAVAAELLAGPLLFGAWRTAIVASAIDAALLWRRVRLEERALAAA